jgi:hypothetical protein
MLGALLAAGHFLGLTVFSTRSAHLLTQPAGITGKVRFRGHEVGTDQAHPRAGIAHGGTFRECFLAAIRTRVALLRACLAGRDTR